MVLALIITACHGSDTCVRTETTMCCGRSAMPNRPASLRLYKRAGAVVLVQVR